MSRSHGMKVYPFLVAMMTSAALAQAPAAATDLDATLLFQLLGSANAITVDVPDSVLDILVVGMYGGLVQLAVEASTDAGSGARRIEITAIGVTAVGRCDATAFAQIVFVDDDGRRRAGRSTSRCFDGEERLAFAKLHTGLPLFFGGSMTELPLDTWLAFESMRVGRASIDTLADAFVFYVYLNTAQDRTSVGMPEYDSWGAAARAFDRASE